MSWKQAVTIAQVIKGHSLAHQQHPERWSKQLRNWDYIAEVYLNPEKEAA